MILSAIRRVLFWTYSRGSWQYDIICLVILAFIFFTPRNVFDRSAPRDLKSGESTVSRKSDPSAGHLQGGLLTQSDRTDSGEQAQPLPESTSDSDARLNSKNDENQEQQP